MGNAGVEALEEIAGDLLAQHIDLLGDELAASGRPFTHSSGQARTWRIGSG